MKFGDGWYLFRCGRCGGAFVATGLAEWCDCGNTDWQLDGETPERARMRSKDAIVMEMDLAGADGCVVTWDERLAGSVSEWVAKMKDRHRNRTAIKWAEASGVQ